MFFLNEPFKIMNIFKFYFIKHKNERNCLKFVRRLNFIFSKNVLYFNKIEKNFKKFATHFMKKMM